LLRRVIPQVITVSIPVKLDGGEVQVLAGHQGAAL